MNPIVREERVGAFHGVEGRFFAVTVGGDRYRPVTFTSQRFITSRKISAHETIRVEIRFDDACRNGHNSFAITGEIRDSRKRRDGGIVACGCIHDDIAKHFPELAALVGWHLCAADGPMHYVANTVYHASDRDPRGKRAGEPCAFAQVVRFGGVPISHKLRDNFARFLRDDRSGFDFEVIRVDHGDRGRPGKPRFAPKFTFGGYGKAWHECPFDSEDEALNFLNALRYHNPVFDSVPALWSEGKARDLDLARSAAIWPEATDAELMQEPEALKVALLARLPDLLARFRSMIEAGGFLWAPKVQE